MFFLLYLWNNAFAVFVSLNGEIWGFIFNLEICEVIECDFSFIQGVEGIQKVMEILEDEFHRTMYLSGK